MFLTSFEIQQLTGFTRASAQARELNRLGIVHKVNKANEIIVSRSHVEKSLDGGVDVKVGKTSPVPNFEGLYG